MLRLARAAASELDDQRAERHRAHDLVRMTREDLVLRACQVVLGQRADLLEQPRALGVVEEAARQAPRTEHQARARLARQIALSRALSHARDDTALMRADRTRARQRVRAVA